LDNAVAQWQIGRAVPIPGVSGRGQADPGFLPAQVTRMFLRRIIEFQPGPTEQHAWAAESRHRRAPAGPAVKYQLEWFHHDKSDPRLRRGDVLVFVTADEWLHPPAVVDSEAIAIPRSPFAIGHLLRSRTDLDPIPVPVAEQILADAGHPNPRLKADHRIASPSLRAAVLGLWNL
ncbi:phosphatidylserine/phosphatidylglycerophosphate/cardiolipin synthase family protein, partial [Rhodococcus sp. NPDC057014]